MGWINPNSESQTALKPKFIAGLADFPSSFSAHLVEQESLRRHRILHLAT